MAGSIMRLPRLEPLLPGDHILTILDHTVLKFKVGFLVVRLTSQSTFSHGYDLSNLVYM